MSLPVTVKVAQNIWITEYMLKTMQMLTVKTVQWESLQCS
jgi:hypothetical protein